MIDWIQQHPDKVGGVLLLLVAAALPFRAKLRGLAAGLAGRSPVAGDTDWQTQATWCVDLAKAMDEAGEQEAAKALTTTVWDAIGRQCMCHPEERDDQA